MRNTFKVVWAHTAIADLESISDYLLIQWTEKELKKFLNRLNKRIDLIAASSELYPNS